jgi:prepilin-type N-terminal cleavage/methylation domain-containing protein/prepilin-type processing-associated H-X9-DG protein
MKRQTSGLADGHGSVPVNNPAARSAYTLTEMLIVIAIISVLVALLLPAVNAAREAARRSGCSHRLAQLILGVQQYESTHQVYPPGVMNLQGPIASEPKGYHHNWIGLILPHLEQRPLARQIDRRVGVYHPANVNVRLRDIGLLRCPSSLAKGRGYSDYVGLHHSTEAPIDMNNDGVFFLNSRLRYEQIVDGTTQTLFLGEKLTGLLDLGWLSGTRATLRNTGVPINFRLLAQRGRGTARGANGPPADLDPTNELSWDDSLLLEELFGSTRESYLIDELPQLKAQFQSLNRLELVVGGLGSYHPGGSQFAYGDGSVTFLSTNTDRIFLAQLASRIDRSVLGRSQR